MKLLCLLRHGEARARRENETDFQRDLTERGWADSRRVGERLREKAVGIDWLLSSDAERARQTARAVAGELSLSSGSIRHDHRLYTVSDHAEFFRIIAGTEAAIDRLMVVGHNPVFEEIISLFEPTFAGRLPAGGLVALQVMSDDWRITGADSVKIDFMIMPGWF